MQTEILNPDLHLGEVINELLEKKHISVVEFGERLNVSRSRAYTMLNSENLNTKSLPRIADALGVKTSKLIQLAEKRAV